ncbi:hypothetical protein CVIRNUC_003468 [Coccomyxa viridis]|uniref:Uncharacterized protein n=1 Tax=Coccomyxa viridis TaxID=1274662 RepID=A0AAV1HZJ5_9CHLO|nr:hypothetical protein CVIRNUC_003468 [Coccomyxa viridis]
MLQGDKHRLETLRTQAIDDHRVGLYSDTIHQYLSLLNATDAASAQSPDLNTSSVIDAVMFKPIRPDRARCQVYRHIATHKCFRSRDNSTELKNLKKVLQTSEQLCEVSWSALSNYTVETHLPGCFQSTAQNETCSDHALSCMTALQLSAISVMTNESIAPSLQGRDNSNDTLDIVTKASITVRNGALMAYVNLAISVGFTIASLIPGVDVIAAPWILANVLNAITVSTLSYTWNQLEKAIRANATDPHGIADKRKIHWWCQILPYLFKHCYDTH